MGKDGKSFPREKAFTREAGRRGLNGWGWLLDTMRCIERMGKETFTLRELYAFVPELKVQHPENNNIEAKLRQQLQLLRDAGLIEFTPQRGVYQISSN